VLLHLPRLERVKFVLAAEVECKGHGRVKVFESDFLCCLLVKLRVVSLEYNFVEREGLLRVVGVQDNQVLLLNAHEVVSLLRSASDDATVRTGEEK